MRMTNDPKHIVIIGAGLAGSLLACFMARRGHRVSVYERRNDPRASGFIGGRSINLALSARGLNGLRRAGLDEEIMRHVVPMRARIMHSRSGQLTRQPYSKDSSDAINSVSRGGLNLTCVEAAEKMDGVRFHFGHRCLDIDLDAPSATFETDDQSEPIHVDADIIIGADGAYSAVRGAMQKTPGFNYQQQYLKHGYKELTIPPTDDGEFAIEAEVLHIWPRGGFMMIALPNVDKSFTCTLFWPYTGPNGLDTPRTDEELLAYFKREFPDAVPLMPTLVEDFRENPVGSLVTVRCNPWHHGSTVALIGDAAHAIVPFYGQGINAGFEDCVVLDECLEEFGDDWERVFEAYTARRVEHGDAIADLALINFIEMRDKVGSRWFLMKKKTEKALHRMFPGIYTPLYNMVSFSTVPYAEARRRARRQDRIVIGIAASILLILFVPLIFVLF